MKYLAEKWRKNNKKVSISPFYLYVCLLKPVANSFPCGKDQVTVVAFCNVTQKVFTIVVSAGKKEEPDS